MIGEIVMFGMMGIVAAVGTGLTTTLVYHNRKKRELPRATYYEEKEKKDLIQRFTYTQETDEERRMINALNILFKCENGKCTRYSRLWQQKIAYKEKELRGETDFFNDRPKSHLEISTFHRKVAETRAHDKILKYDKRVCPHCNSGGDIFVTEDDFDWLEHDPYAPKIRDAEGLAAFYNSLDVLDDAIRNKNSAEAFAEYYGMPTTLEEAAERLSEIAKADTGFKLSDFKDPEPEPEPKFLIGTKTGSKPFYPDEEEKFALEYMRSRGFKSFYIDGVLTFKKDGKLPVIYRDGQLINLEPEPEPEPEPIEEPIKRSSSYIDWYKAEEMKAADLSPTERVTAQYARKNGSRTELIDGELYIEIHGEMVPVKGRGIMLASPAEETGVKKKEIMMGRWARPL